MLTYTLCARRALLVALLFSLSLLTPLSAPRAQVDDDTARAVELHKRAQERFQYGEFDEAAKLYREALALIDHPDLKVRLAQVLTAQNNHQGALDLCSEALESPLLTEQTRKAAGECIKSSQLRLDEVSATVNTSPTGAQLRLDGAPLGRTPWRGVLPPGRRQFDFELEGHHPTSRLVNARRGGKVYLNVSLMPKGLGGLLTLRTTPEGANILIDDEFVGQSPLVSFPTAVGTHQLKVMLPGYVSEVRPLNMSEGRVEELMIYLTPERGRVSATDLWPAWALMGTGALTGVMGGLFGFQALSARSDADSLARSDGSPAGRDAYNLHVRDMESYRSTSDILWVSSAVLVTGGLTWWLLSR
jgi:hypothetical protein